VLHDHNCGWKNLFVTTRVHESVWQLGSMLILYCRRGAAQDGQLFGLQPGTSLLAARMNSRVLVEVTSHGPLTDGSWNCGRVTGYPEVGSSCLLLNH